MRKSSPFAKGGRFQRKSGIRKDAGESLAFRKFVNGLLTSFFSVRIAKAVARRLSTAVGRVQSFYHSEVPMFTRRISVVLCSVALVVVYVFAAQLLLFAYEWGEHCVPGNIETGPQKPEIAGSGTVTLSSGAVVPATITTYTVIVITYGDRGCEVSSCDPPGWTCTEVEDRMGKVVTTRTKTSVMRFLNEDENGNAVYKSGAIGLQPLPQADGTYKGCSDDYGTYH